MFFVLRLGISIKETACADALRNFRSRIAYNRWWEGGTLLQQTRGEWFNGYSSLIAWGLARAAKVARPII